ncbi:MAG: acyltransferase, partial [Lentisphaeria bacterium]|nr:acyltransferase [Lentisphaeria bacterium]
SGSFKTDFPGFSAISCQLVSPCPSGSGPWKFELCTSGGDRVAASAVQMPALLKETPVKIRFSERKAGEWRLIIRNSSPIPASCRDLRLKCILYAGTLPVSRYWYGILAFGVFFIVIGYLDHVFRKNDDRLSRGRRADFDFGIHYFRAFAIFFIMILHYHYFCPELRVLNNTLFSSASYFFVFISGYLFYYLTHGFAAEWHFSGTVPFLKIRTVSGKFSITDYYRKKLLNILLPYFLFSSAIFLYVLLYSDTTQFVPAVPGIWKDFFFRLRTGAVQGPYWYIYFISKVFLVSPLLLFLPRKSFIAVTAASCVLPFIFTRVQSHFSYFLPMYLLGMAYARFRLSADRFLYRPAVRIAVILLTAAGLIFYYPGTEEQTGLVYVIRLLMTIDLMYLTSFLSRWRIPWLSYCADVSFTFFFIHDFVFAYVSGPVWKLFYGIFKAVPGLEIIIPAILIAVTILTAAALKILFGRFSRRFIGS